MKIVSAKWLTIGTLVILASRACGQVRISADLASEKVEQTFSAGDVITLPFLIGPRSAAGLCGVELEFACETTDIQICSASVHTAFSVVLLEEPEALPGSFYSTKRSRPLSALGQPLARGGGGAALATVELEVLNGSPFSSALEVNIRGVKIGRRQSGTSLQLSDAAPVHSGSTRIVIRNVSPADETPPAPASEQPDQWTCEVAGVNLQLRPLGGGAPVYTLEPETAYEVHYQAGYDMATGYALFVVGGSPDHPMAAATPASAGPWSDTGYFIAVDVEEAMGQPEPAVGYPAGVYRQYLVGDDFLADDLEIGGPTGHLFSFTTGAAGQLNLQLFLYSADYDELVNVEMETQAQFPVLGVSGDVAPE